MAVAPAPARPRPGGGRLFIIVGLLLAVGAFGLVFLLGSLGGGGSIGGPAQTQVVIAKQPIQLRHQITDADLDYGKVSGVLTNTYTNKSDVVNLIAQINISQGAVITSDMLARDINVVPVGNRPAYLPLAKGYVAMTIPTGEMQGVAGHIAVGDYFTVIASANLVLFGKPTLVVSKTVFTNIRVIGLGPALANVQPASGASSNAVGSQTTSGITSSITVELTQCDAEYLTWFLGNTTVRYTLESFQDYLAQPPAAPDPSCPFVTSAQGVSQKEVDARYHFTSL